MSIRQSKHYAMENKTNKGKYLDNYLLHTWYCVELNTKDYDTTSKIRKTCVEKFGIRGLNWETMYDKNIKFYFRKNADFLIFVLQFSDFIK